MGLAFSKMYFGFMYKLSWEGMTAIVVVGSIALIVVLFITYAAPDSPEPALRLRWRNLRVSIFLAFLLALALAAEAFRGIEHITASLGPIEDVALAMIFRAMKMGLKLPAGVSDEDFLMIALAASTILAWGALAVLIQVFTPKTGVSLPKWKIGEDTFDAPVPLEWLTIMAFVALAAM